MSNPKNRKKDLFFTFLKIGAFTFGGGYAMIPLIKREIVDDRKWISDEEMMDMIAIAESTPGPIAINAATFVGWQIAGFGGALCATGGVCLPSFLVMLLIALVMRRIENLPVVADAFTGIRAAVFVLIFSTFLSMFRQMKKDAGLLLLFAGSFVCVGLLHVNAVYVIAAGIILGVMYTWMTGRKNRSADRG